jgi:hypothetical protein
MFFAKKPEGHVTFSTLSWRGQVINIDLFYELLSLYGISAGISGSLLHYRFINNIGRYDIVGRNLIQIPVISINNIIIFKNKLIKNYIIDINHICSMEKNFFSVKFEMKDGRKFYTIPKYIIDIKEKN